MRRTEKSLNRTVKTNLKYQTKEFFSNSTLHGVRYIAEKGRSFSEKFMWFCFVAIGAVAAFVIIASLWEKFQTNPTITGLDTDFHDQQLDFPTVTVCPKQPFNSSVVNVTAYSLLGRYESESHLNIPMLEALAKLSYDNIDVASRLVSEVPPSMLKYWEEQTLRQWAFGIADTCESVIESCKFRTNLVPSCCDEFKPIYSERGFCYSFNARYFGTEDSEEKLTNFSFISETDKSWSLEVQLRKEARVYLHSVDEVFGYDFRPQFSWERDQSVDLLISMKQTYTTEDARQLTIGQRKCIFPDTSSDFKITYYRNDKYSLSACTKQCRMLSAIKNCKCMPPFYAPANAREYKYCELKDLSCLSRYAVNITNIAKCSSCELSCLNTVYDMEKMSQSSGNEKSDGKEARITIEFLTWPIIRYKREVLFGWVDLLVSFGGIAGLFLGFSLLSGVELLYYFTVRASCMMYKNRQQLYAVQEEEDSRPLPNYDMSLRPKFKRSEQRMANIQMVAPVAARAASFLSPSSADGAADRFGMNERPLAIPPMNIKTRQDSTLPATGYGEINTGLLNNRVERSTDELPSNYGDKQAPLTQAMAGRKFQRYSNAPYATNIKTLDRNFKRRVDVDSRDPNLVYHGYLP